MKAETSKEQWKPIKGYEEYYLISNKGNVKSLDREWEQKHYSGNNSKYYKKGKLLKPQQQKNGYMTIDLHKDKNLHRKLIHRLVAEHFIENVNNYKYINHIDGNIQNNSVNNLEWCTQSYNIQYAYNCGRKIPPHMKKVAQIDGATGNLVREYISIAEAVKQTGIKNISKCCRKLRKKAGGYKWQYV